MVIAMLATLCTAVPARAQQGAWDTADEPLFAPRPQPGDSRAPIMRLPPVQPYGAGTYPAEGTPPGGNRLAMVPPSGDNSSYFADPRNPVMPPEVLDEPDSKEPFRGPKPPQAKDGMLQWTTVRRATLLPGNRATGLGITDLTWQTIIGIPLPSREKPLLITPYFGVHWLAGPQPVDMPAELYDVSLEFRILRQVTPRLGVDYAVAPSIYSDFQNMGHKAYRVTGRAVALYSLDNYWQVAGGVAYLGWATLPVLPVGGLIWSPNDDWRMELIVPRPRIVRRFLDGPHADWWWYCAGEVGGNSSAIKRADGQDDGAP